MYWNQFTPSSAFFSSGTPSERLYSMRCAAPVAHCSSTIVRKALHFTDDILSRFDCISKLGGEDVCGEEIGHAGCVNALAWSQSGHCLATGSDDRRVILWKLGGSDEHPSGVSPSRYQNATDGRSFPRLDLSQSDVIETGHRANIFNVKWAPNCSDRRLFTCAGDNQVRVFDLSRATSAAAAIDRPMTSGREYRLWQEGQGACTRVLRCHSGRAKKISTENSPDIFLTAAEDGEVRQTDLRVPHTCSRSHNNYGQGCPRPLVQFQMELYSLSVSKLEPWLFAVSGSSDNVFLQDRRMIPRLLKKEWGSYIDEETAALTHCVRRFTREPPSDPNSPSARRGRRAHITAVKISEANGRDLLASFSGDGVYRFDIKSEVDLPKAQGEEERTHLHSSKRQKTADSGGEEAASAVQSSLEGRDDCDSIRRDVVSLLFLQGADNRVTRRYSKMLAELDQMNESVHSMLRPAKWLARERCVIAICRVLIQIRRATAGLVETVDIDFTSLKEGLDADLTEEAKGIVLPLLDEMEEANKWRAYSEEVKIRVLLWARTEEYIRAWWKNAWPEEEMREDMTMESQLQGTAETPISDILEEGADSSGPGTSTCLRHVEVQSGNGSGADRDWDDQSNAGDGSEDEDDDIDVDDDDLSDEESSEDEEDRNKHGISGGDAAIAYPCSCYTGHANLETVKDCGFLGSNDEYIWSGSDCGHFFVWSNGGVGKLLGVWKGDGSVVNVLAQHPSLPICAVSGIDETIKIFGPVSRGSPRHTDAFARRDEIMQRNSEQEGSVGFSSQSLMRLFARHMAAAQDIPLPLARQRAGEGQDDDCTVA